MSSQHTQNGSRRSFQRGGRRSSSRRGGFSSNRSEVSAPKKKSLWESILGFFGHKSEKSTNVRARDTQVRGRTGSSEKPTRPTGFRKPEAVEVTSPRIYVGNLSFDATESDLFELFNGVGLVQNVEVVVNRHTMRSKGFAFVQMQTIDEAKRAVTELHDREYLGRKLVVSGAKAVDEKRSERSRQPEQ